MLKIKNNVDLKELEKYGFTYYEKYKRYSGAGDGKYTNEIYICEIDRIIHNVNCDEMCNDYDEEFLDVIYNLTKDGLVEKVD